MSAGISFNVGALGAGLDAMVLRVAAANEAGAVAGGLIYEREIKRQIQGGHPKGTKTGASPGGPPQNITGNLRRSVTMSPPRGAGLRVTVDIGPSAFYGGFVNDGTPRMAAYPYVEPGAKIAEPQAHAVIVSAWARAIS